MVCDLGTSNFRAAIVGSDTIVSEPCVIAIDKNHVVTVGAKAYAMVGRNPNLIEIVSPMEGGVIRNVEAAAEIIKYCAQVLGQSRWMRRFSLTMAVPSGLTPVELRALEDAGRFAGAKHVTFVNASVAAAIGAGLPVDGPNGCLVVNLGGGVTEVALLSMKGIVASHGVRMGGQAINEGIIERVRKEHFFHIGLRSTEEFKRNLSDDRQIDQVDVRGRDLKSGLPRSLVLPRSVVDEPMTSYCDTIVDLICLVISQCPPELAGDIIQRGVLLLGGGANITGLVHKLGARLEAPIVIADEPEISVIQGLLKSQADSRPTFRFTHRRRHGTMEARQPGPS